MSVVSKDEQAGNAERRCRDESDNCQNRQTLCRNNAERKPYTGDFDHAQDEAHPLPARTEVDHNLPILVGIC